MIDALTKLVGKLKTFRTFPTNGIAMFASSDAVHMVELPKPQNTWVYKCSNEFYLEPLLEMMKNDHLVAVIAIDATEFGIGIIDGPRWFVIDSGTSGVSGKSNQGGSSFRRYERNRDALLNGFYHRAAEHANNLLLSKYNPAELVISGPGFTKDDFLKTGYLDYRLRAKISHVIGIEYAGFEGVLQTFNRLGSEEYSGADV